MTDPARSYLPIPESELFGSTGLELLNQVLARARVAVIAADDEAHDFAILYWSRGAEELYGYSKEEAIGKSYMDLIVADDEREKATQDHRRLLDDPSTDVAWQRMANDVTSTGQRLPVIYSGFRLMSPHLGRHIMVEVNVDISKSLFTAQTASAPDDKAVVASGAELEDIERRAVADTYGVIVPLLTHRAGGAIDAILTEREWVEDELPEPVRASVVERLDRIGSRAVDLRDLLDDLCDLSRDEPPRSRVNVLQLVLSTKLAWFRAELRNVDVSYEIDRHLVCTTYELLLREALSSVITNACEAVLRTPVKGGVAAAGDVVVRAVADVDAGQVLIHVDDNGPGLQADVFHADRIRPTLKQHKHGHRHGHGLMYAERALDLVRGELCLSPEPSPLGGARVTIVLHNQFAVDAS